MTAIRIFRKKASLMRKVAMETLKMKVKPSRQGRISIRIPENLRSRELELIVIMEKTGEENKKKREKKFDFSGIAGRLQWKGNPIREQRRLRNEWR